jgi:glycosyltransferase involved in cell wall biosynthesis
VDSCLEQNRTVNSQSVSSRPVRQVAQSAERDHRVILAVTVPYANSLWGAVPQLLLDRGIAVTMVSSDLPTTGNSIRGVEYRVLRMRRAVSPLADILALVRWCIYLREVSPDVVVAATPKAGLLAMLAAKIVGVPARMYHVWGCRWDGHSGPIALFTKFAERVACWAATDVIAVGHDVRKLLNEHHICGGKSRVLGWGASKGVDLEKFGAVDPIALDTRTPTIGFAGRLARDKGIGFLLSVFAAVRRHVPNVKLLIAGGIDDADTIDQSTITALQDCSAVTLAGVVTDMPAFFSAVDVLCFPSLREGLPNVVIEAAACGVPTVAWRVTGIGDAILDGKTGYCVPFGHVEEMAQRIVEILESKELRRQLGSNGEAFVRERFSSSLVAELHANEICLRIATKQR